MTRAALAGNAAGQTSGYGWAFWPELDAYVRLRSDLRLQFAGQSHKGEDDTYRQRTARAEIGYQLKPIFRPHKRNINDDKEHYLVLAGSYEYLETSQPGKSSHENRGITDMTLRHRPTSGLLLSDRNRVEFRWVNGKYSTRYRNRLTAEHDFQVDKFRFAPYASAEGFYDGRYQSWKEFQYALGVQVPYKRLLLLDTFYLRQNCSTCSPNPLNVWGLTLNIYF
jgi:hypothetical protein